MSIIDQNELESTIDYWADSTTNRLLVNGNNLDIKYNWELYGFIVRNANTFKDINGCMGLQFQGTLKELRSNANCNTNKQRGIK